MDDYVLPYGYRGFPVVENGVVLGVISIPDLKGLPRDQWTTTSVAERMTPIGPDLVVEPELPLSEALKRLALADAGRLLLIRDHRLVGMLTKSGLVRFVELRRVLEED